MITRILLLLIFLLTPWQAKAADKMDIDAFAHLPVQHEGRIKPLDTLARAFLTSLSGRNSIGGQNADEWFAQILFDPAGAINKPVFRILAPRAIGLHEKDGKYYSYAEIFEFLAGKRETIEKLAAMPPQDWSDDQKQLMMLSEQSILYTQFLRSMTYILPLEIDVPSSLAKAWNLADNKPYTLRDISPFEEKLKKKTAQIVRRKGTNPERYNDAEREIAAFAFFFDTIKTNGSNNFALRVVPPDSGEEWASPWVALQTSGPAKTQEFIADWSALAAAYKEGNAAVFNETIDRLAQAYAPYTSPARTNLEAFYNGAHPVGVSMTGYLLAFLAFAGFALSGKASLRLTALGLLSFSALLHVAAIAARVYILSRPPVGTLYESILFVAAIVVIGALIIEYKRRDGHGILAGSLCGAFLLFISEAFAGEDTMHMLIAVLNTNFWLATHVLCITIGYGICLMTSALAHIHMAKGAVTSQKTNLMTAIKTTGLMALLFTAVGTILGGIWADQSWGRFWGWDPKENGALLIVLWLAWAYHGHLSGHLKGTAFTAVMAALSVIVALAWFGVNLLNVGLHSYGFITGVAAALFAFCAIEFIAIGYLWWRIEKRAQA